MPIKSRYRVTQALQLDPENVRLDGKTTQREILPNLWINDQVEDPLKAEIDPDAWETLHGNTSGPFEKPKSGRIAVKGINHLGDEVINVSRI